MTRTRSALSVLAITFLGAIAFNTCHAYTSMTIAVDSNILVFEGKVLFAQGTGSLTMLDLETGRAVLRKPPPKDFRFSGTLYKHRHGIILVGYSRTSLLDAATLDLIWSIENSSDAAIGDDYFISHDGYHTVTCYDIATGSKTWATTMQGGWQLLASGDYSVISTPLIYDEGHEIRHMRLSSGKTLFSRKADKEEQFLNIYQDDTSVFVLTSTKDAPLLHHEPIPKNLVELDAHGDLVRTVNFQEDSIIGQYGYKTPRHGFFFEGRYYSSEGKVRNAYQHEPDVWASEWEKDDSLAESIASGVVVERSAHDKSGKRGTVLDFVSRHSEWTGYVSYYDEGRWLGNYTEADGKLVFASGRGHVECVDIATGNPQWLYVFPVIRRTMSYSSYAMPPMLTQQASAYRKGLAKLGVNSGTLKLTEDSSPSDIVFADFVNNEPYSGAIIVDPMPDDPFADYVPKLVYRAIAFAAVPVLIMSCIVVVLIRRRKSSCESAASDPVLFSNDYRLIAVFALPLGVIAFIGIVFYGRVDPTITMCLWSVIGLAVFTFFYAGYKSRKLPVRT